MSFCQIFNKPFGCPNYLDEFGSLRQPELDGVGLPLEVEEADEGEARGQEREGDRQHGVPRHQAAMSV